MKKFIVIKADYNDADYAIEKSEISDEEIIKIREILNKMPRGKHDNGKILNNIPYETLDLGNDDKEDSDYNYITSEEKDFLGEFLPYGDANYPGIHTIESVEILTESEKIL